MANCKLRASPEHASLCGTLPEKGCQFEGLACHEAAFLCIKSGLHENVDVLMLASVLMIRAQESHVASRSCKLELSQLMSNGLTEIRCYVFPSTLHKTRLESIWSSEVYFSLKEVNCLNLREALYTNIQVCGLFKFVE